MSFKKILLSVCRPIGRLIVCTLGQMIWFLPISVGIWWFKQVWPDAIHSHFGVDKARDVATSLTAYAETMKNMTSFSNPASFFSYLSAFLKHTNASAKYATLEMISSTAESMVLWGLDFVFALACVYAVYRIYKAYRANAQAYTLTKNIVNQINPQIEALHAQIAILQQQLSEVKDSLDRKK